MRRLSQEELPGRVLIILPASLQVQWQSELRSKFNEESDVLDGELRGHVQV